MEGLGIHIHDPPPFVLPEPEPEFGPAPEPAPRPAALASPAPAPLPPRLLGHLDTLRRTLVAGWAYDEARPGQPVVLAVLVDGIEVARQAATLHRRDLEAAGIGTGRHGFAIAIPFVPADMAHRVAVQHAVDGRHIGQSPGLLEPAIVFDAVFEQTLSRIFDKLPPGDVQDHAIRFLQMQTDKLQQQRHRARGGLAARSMQLWPAARPNHAPPSPTDAPVRRCALIIDDALPQDTGGPAVQAILAHMQALRAMDYAVKFVVAADPAPNQAAAASLAAHGVECCEAPHHALLEASIQPFAGAVDVVYFHRVPSVAHYLPLVRRHLPQARVFCRSAGTAERLRATAGPQTLQWTRIEAGWPAPAESDTLPVEAALLRRAQNPAPGPAWPLPPPYLAAQAASFR